MAARTRPFPAAALLAALLLSCSPAPAPPQGDGLRIGVIAYSESSAGASCCGGPTREAVQVLREEEQGEGGGVRLGGKRVPVLYVVRTVDSTPEAVASAATALVTQDHVSAIVGPQHSGDAIAAGEVVERSRVPLVTPMSTNPRVTEGRRFVFRAGFTDDLQAAALASFGRGTLKARRAAILFDVTEPYSRGMAATFRKRFEELGGTVSGEASFPSGAEDFRKELAELAKGKPDLLLLPNYKALVGPQGVQAREVGIRAVLLGGDGWSEDTLPRIPAFEGSFKSGHYSTGLDTPENRAFLARFRRSVGHDPVDAAAMTWDAAHIVMAAAEKAGSREPVAIRDALSSLSVRGVSGEIAYRGGGDPDKVVVIKEFRGGKVEYRATDRRP